MDEIRDLVVSRARRRELAVRVEPIARMPHRTRVARLLDDSPDGSQVTYGGPWAVAVRGLPADRPLRVRGARMPEDSPYRARWHSIWVEADARPPARTEDVGYVLVDEARLAFADPDALTAWRTDEPVDGLADLAFWGRDAQVLATTGCSAWPGQPRQSRRRSRSAAAPSAVSSPPGATAPSRSAATWPSSAENCASG